MWVSVSLDLVSLSLALLLLLSSLVLVLLSCGLCPRRGYTRLPLHTELDQRPLSPPSSAPPDDALLAARFYLRGSSFALAHPLPALGSRRNKHCFLVRSPDGSQLLMTLIFAELRLDRLIFADIVTGLRSHFVASAVEADYVEEKKLVVVFRRVSAKGSLRDVLCNAKWDRPAAVKYGGRKTSPLTETRIATWGRHILEGINYLRLKGLPAGHVHCGNILVENNVCKISDYENKLVTSLKPALLGLIQHDSCAGVDPDVVCFGAILFEMATGFPMDVVDLSQRPSGQLSPAVLAVLDSIFYSAARPRPSLETLLDLPFFAKVEMPNLPPLPRTRLGPKAKEALRECRRLAPASGGEVKKPPRVAPRPHKYDDTKLTVTAYDASKPAATPAVAAAAKPAVATASAASAASSKPAAPVVAPVAAAAAAAPRPAAAVAAPAVPPAPKPPASKATAPASAAAPPPPPPPAAPGAPPPPPPPAVARAPGGRGGLLSSIEGFSKGGLKKTVTVDKSKPVFK